MGREGFEDRVLNRLSELGEIAVRPMFGGYGLFWRDVIFGVAFRDRLYFKVDDRTKGEYVSSGEASANQRAKSPRAKLAMRQAGRYGYPARRRSHAPRR